jgi:hypothetical protein
MRPRTLWLFVSAQMLLVVLGGWAFAAGGAVWLLVLLMLLVFSAGMRLLVQADAQSAKQALEEELRCLRALMKSQTAPVVPADHGCKSETSLAECHMRIQQLEAELRMLCPPSKEPKPSAAPS